MSASTPAPQAIDSPSRRLIGDGTWPFSAVVDGEDIVVRGGYATWFGGDSDPMDDGLTASGIVTRHNPGVEGVSVAMRDIGCASTDGSPLPRMPFRTTKVELYFPTTGVHLAGDRAQPIIDIGPAKHATTDPAQPHTIDLTLATFKLSGVSPAQGIVRVDYRILGGAKFVHPA